jgi:UDP-N-acetylglucosamine 2-epimerase (non-hydrolysing)
MRLVSIVSARPNFIKLASIAHAIEKSNQRSASSGQHIEHIIVHTGQHYDPLLSDVFFKELGISQPQVNLGVKGGGDNDDTVKRTKEATIPILQELKPDLVVVYGDVSGALAGAQAAHALHLPVAHIEAGLRSFDPTMPEEGNRIAIDHVAKLLFVTEKSGLKNLDDENVTEGVHFVGNTMIDTLLKMMPIIEKTHRSFTAAKEPFAVVTLHRPNNVDEPLQLERIMGFLAKVASHISIVLPMHPRLTQRLTDSGKAILGANIFGIPPVAYLEFIHLMKDAAFILTDSGGIQEEATLLGKRCFTLRKNTERPSTVEAGSNALIDLEKADDRERVLSYAKDPKPPHVAIPELWDGKAGERIVKILQDFLAKTHHPIA